MAPHAIIFALTNPDPEVRSFVAPGPFRRFVVRQAFNSWETRWGETSSTTAMSAPDRPDSARSFAAARESAATSRCRSPSSRTALRAATTTWPSALSIWGRISTSIVDSSLMPSTRLMYSRAVLHPTGADAGDPPLPKPERRWPSIPG